MQFVESHCLLKTKYFIKNVISISFWKKNAVLRRKFTRAFTVKIYEGIQGIIVNF